MEDIAQLEAAKVAEIEKLEQPDLSLNFVDDILLKGSIVNLEVEVEGVGKVNADFDAYKLQNQLKKKADGLSKLLDLVNS